MGLIEDAANRTRLAKLLRYAPASPLAALAAPRRPRHLIPHAPMPTSKPSPSP